MVLGLSISAFTTLHVLLSLVGIASGLVAVAAMISRRSSPGWTALFLTTTLLTTLTGFLFPISVLTPALIVGLVSLALLIAALLALYAFHSRGAWRWIFVVTAVAALYLNVFVLIVQAFQKIGFLNALAPTQSEPPFLVAQAAALLAFLIAGYLAAVRIPPRGLPAV
ncbi:hypothetical protein [Microbaculum marinum]|uniref:DUF420 domain-containing protein n=1 Tax=Microbaculum marinum TaxID=1764581 RepID=A0AAW9RSI2_9HYPH